MKKRMLKKTISLMLILVFVLACTVTSMATVRNNNTWDTAQAYGNWKYMYGDVVQLTAEQNEVWFSFTAAANDRLFAKIAYDASLEGMFAVLYDANRNPIDMTGQIFSAPITGLQFLTLNANATAANQLFYISVHRPVGNTNHLYTNIQFGDRIKTKTTTFSYTGTASNAGYGADSSILSLNLSNDNTIPNGAIVRSVTTEGAQTPSQGNVKHKIKPGALAWVTSSVSNASSGSYPISVANNIEVKQNWQFCYNALAYASSTMKNVKMTVNYEYDLQRTGYVTF